MVNLRLKEGCLREGVALVDKFRSPLESIADQGIAVLPGKPHTSRVAHTSTTTTMVSSRRKKSFAVANTVVSTHVHKTIHSASSPPVLKSAKNIPSPPLELQTHEANYRPNNAGLSHSLHGLRTGFVPAVIEVENKNDDFDDVSSEVSMELIPDRPLTPRPEVVRKTLRTYAKLASAKKLQVEVDDEWPSDEEGDVLSRRFTRTASHFFAGPGIKRSMCGISCWPNLTSIDTTHNSTFDVPNELPMTARDGANDLRTFSSQSSRDRTLSSSCTSYEEMREPVPSRGPHRRS